ncbi:hypothetical protein E8F11_13050 [Pseudomonas sp. BN417]|uniref:hypothetical protein n=1 Tax=Pseudomonas sp. BN417 TaxID=2567890 RepID=UPI0024540D93|nr:hypothetical protein [Pseudomonas sp. BN417]MDH4556086.1 hypothetical protein [Pseudomonas sp. BN417]
MEIQGNAFSAGLGAIQSGRRRIDQAVGDIAGSSLRRVEPPQAEAADLATRLVALEVGKVEAQAGAKVIETADAALGTLIDTRA